MPFFTGVCGELVPTRRRHLSRSDRLRRSVAGGFRGLSGGDVVNTIEAPHPGTFRGPLKLRQDQPGQRQWRLDAPLAYRTLGGWLIHVEAGRPTDLASVPRVFRSLALSSTRTAWAAIPHDELYRTRTGTRMSADAVLYEAMLAAGAGRFWAWAYYLAVRLGGWRAWRNHPQREGATHAT